MIFKAFMVLQPVLRASALSAAITIATTALFPTGAHGAGSLWSARKALTDERLDAMRGGFEGANGLQISFGIERAIYVNGELVAVTRLVVNDLSRLLSGGPISAQALANAFTVVQNGPGNMVASESGNISTTPAQPGAVPVAAASSAAQAAQTATTILASPAPSSVAPAQSAASNTTASPLVTAAQSGSAVTSAAPVAMPTTAASAAPAASTAAPAVATALPTVATPAPAAAASNSTGASPVQTSAGLTIQVNAAGQTLVLPNASSIVTAVQNSLNNQIIQTRTTIDATLNSLSVLRSSAFADSLRQQALAPGRR
jgi:hypothetical protein